MCQGHVLRGSFRSDVQLSKSFWLSTTVDLHPQLHHRASPRAAYSSPVRQSRASRLFRCNWPPCARAPLTADSQTAHDEHHPLPPPLRQGRFPRAHRRPPCCHGPPRARQPAAEEDPRGRRSADGTPHTPLLRCANSANERRPSSSRPCPS